MGFSTLDREVNKIALPVEGDLPAWLNGTLLRTAPSKFEVGRRSYVHWFDGLAMLHAFDFENGKVTYSNRFIRSEAYREAHEKNGVARGEFMTDPCHTLFGRVKALFHPKRTDNTNVNVTVLGGKVVALTESTLPIQFDPETLSTLGRFQYSGGIGGQVSTAHPHRDAARGYSYVIAMGRRSVYRFFSDENGVQRVLSEIPVSRPAYMHSFGMSERFLIMTEFPLRVNPLRLRLSGKPFIRNYYWEPELGTQFTVIDKSDGKIVARARARPCFAFHHVNAFESGRDLLLDILTYSDAAIIDALRLSRLRFGPPVDSFATLTRFRIPLGRENAGGGNEAGMDILSPARVELPRMDYARRGGRAYGCLWGTGQTQRGRFLDSITKLELSDGAAHPSATWYEEGRYPGEPVFVARPGGSHEDDGVLLSVVLDTEAQRSFLLVLDAATLGERARAAVPHHIPFGFHGNYFSDLPR